MAAVSPRDSVLVVVSVALVLGAVACGDGGEGDAGGRAGAAAETTTTTTRAEPRVTGPPASGFSLASPAFAEGGPIPERFSRQGGDVSPPLSWSPPPEGTVELVLLVEDPDAPGDTPFVHWLVAGLDPGTVGFEAGAVSEGAVEGRNDFGETGWGGPAPPAGETHRYVFTLTALDRRTGLRTGFDRDDYERALAGARILGRARLTATFAG